MLWLCEVGKLCLYLCLHLDWKSKVGLNFEFSAHLSRIGILLLIQEVAQANSIQPLHAAGAQRAVWLLELVTTGLIPLEMGFTCLFRSCSPWGGAKASFPQTKGAKNRVNSTSHTMFTFYSVLFNFPIVRL